MANLKNNFLLPLLALPLAFIGIPIYLNISDFYSKNFAIDLAVIGSALILIRLFDILQDLLVGRISDKIISKNFSRKKLIAISSIALVIAFYLAFNPPLNLSHNLALIWFALSLCLTYTCFNFCIINFESTIALVAKDDFERISLNSKKEFFGLVGLILAFLIPVFFSSYLALSLIFALLITISLIPFLKIEITESDSQKLSLITVFKNKEFVIFLGVFLLNSIATSLPAANLNFYVRDVLQAEENLGYFLSIYFLSAGVSIIFWKNFAQKKGLVKTWITAIFGSIITFCCAYFLEAGDGNYFYLICLSSGFFLGGDLIIPPALLAKITQNKDEIISSYFAMWNMTTKIGLMIAASFSLIALGKLGYQPSNPKKGIEAISIFYAALPCLIKIFVAFFLIKLQRNKNLPSYEN